MGGTDEPRLPHGTERPERPSRLIGLGAAVVALGLCTGLASIGLTATVPADGDAASAGATATVRPAGAGAARGAGQDTPTAPPPRLSVTGPLALIADDVVLPRESDDGWSGTNYEVSFCPGPSAQYPGLRTANDLRVIQSVGQSPRRVQLLAVTADEEAAGELVRQLAHPFESCRFRGSEIGTRATAPISGDQWQEGTMLAISLPGDDGEARVNASLVVARAGRAVVAQAVVGEDAPATDGSSVDPSVADELQAFLDDMSQQVCRYRAGGCHTPPPPVYAPPPGSAQLPDGTYQLPDGSVVAPDGSVLTPAPAEPEPAPEPADQQPGQLVPAQP